MKLYTTSLIFRDLLLFCGADTFSALSVMFIQRSDHHCLTTQLSLFGPAFPVPLSLSHTPLKETASQVVWPLLSSLPPPLKVNPGRSDSHVFPRVRKSGRASAGRGGDGSFSSVKDEQRRVQTQAECRNRGGRLTCCVRVCRSSRQKCDCLHVGVFLLLLGLSLQMDEFNETGAASWCEPQVGRGEF